MSRGARSGYTSDELEEWNNLDRDLVEKIESEDLLGSSSFNIPMSYSSIKERRKR